MQIDVATLERMALQGLLEGAIIPLPIALVSTVGPDGVYNAAPFSLVFPVCWQPPIVCASFGYRKGRPKDTSKNIAFSQDFVINIMDEGRIKATARAAADYPPGIDEMKEVGLTAAPAVMVKSPRVAEAQVSFECRLVQTLNFGEGAARRDVIFGEVVWAHLRDELWVEGRIEPSRLKAVGRLANGVYCRTGDIFRQGIA